MKKETKIINYISLNIDELNGNDKKLLLEAEKALEGSYSPYSEFRVGVAVLLQGNIIVRGANQENSAYPSGLCAERVALFYAGANYREDILAIAITAYDKNGIKARAFPCGACLQVMKEVEKRTKQKLRIIVQIDTHHVFIFESLDSLMPFPF